MADVKPEIKPEIKVEPTESTLDNLAEADEFEEDNDLAFPPDDGTRAWLVKLPKYVWEAWSDVYRDAPNDRLIEIGKMRVYDHEQEGDTDPRKQKVMMRLNAGIAEHKDLPRNYDLKITTDKYSNLVVFSEKDLPGHKNQPFGRRNNHLSANSRPSGIPSKNDRYGGQPTKPGTYRSAIPKQTALAPPIQNIADAAPVEDASYYAHFQKTYAASLQPKKTTTFQAGIDRNMHPGKTNISTFNAFGITSKPQAGGKLKKKVPKEKAVRMPENDLLDAIIRCFKLYQYWSLRALKIQLKQPEQWIKQVLEGVADLVRSGQFAMQYRLKPDFAANHDIRDVKEEVKSEGEEETGMSSGEMTDDEEGMEMEDVKMEEAGGSQAS